MPLSFPPDPACGRRAYAARRKHSCKCSVRHKNIVRQKMKTTMKLIILTLLSIQCVIAGGSISWEDVKSSIAKSDPELVKVIENSFIVNRSGGGVRLGPHFGDRQGERIPSYEFGAQEKKTKVQCVLVIEESEDYAFTGRFKFVKKFVEAQNQEAEQPGTGPPATRPAETLEKDAAGQVSLESLLRNQPFLILTPSYRGKASLVYHRGIKDEEIQSERELHFKAFAPDGSRYGEPDCPHPKLPAIFEATPLGGGGGGFVTGAFAYLADAPSIESLSECTTTKELIAVVPDLVQEFAEGAEPVEYFFNWFSLSNDGQLSIVLLSVESGPKDTLQKVQIWRGLISPSK